MQLKSTKIIFHHEFLSVLFSRFISREMSNKLSHRNIMYNNFDNDTTRCTFSYCTSVIVGCQFNGKFFRQDTRKLLQKFVFRAVRGEVESLFGVLLCEKQLVVHLVHKFIVPKTRSGNCENGTTANNIVVCNNLFILPQTKFFFTEKCLT